MFGDYRLNRKTRRAEFLAPKSSLLCAILFAVHPIHAESVSVLSIQFHLMPQIQTNSTNVLILGSRTVLTSGGMTFATLVFRTMICLQNCVYRKNPEIICAEQ